MSMDLPRSAFTIPEFCARNSISPAHYFNLKRRNQGPREIRAGKSVRISLEAEADWQRAREAASAAEATETTAA